MKIDTFCSLNFNARLECEAMEEVAYGIAALFDIDAPRSRIGLIVASDNAGTATSVQFWSDAMRTGVAVASPALFPWCLANAPCGVLARRFNVTGPNSTLLGEGDALLAALDTASDQLAQGQVDCAVVVALCFANSQLGGTMLGLRASADGGNHSQQLDGLYAACNAASLRTAIGLPRVQLGGCAHELRLMQ